MRAFFKKTNGDVQHFTIEGFSLDQDGQIVMKRAPEIVDVWKYRHGLWKSDLNEKARSIEIIP